MCYCERINICEVLCARAERRPSVRRSFGTRDVRYLHFEIGWRERVWRDAQDFGKCSGYLERDGCSSHGPALHANVPWFFGYCTLGSRL